jgi:hypothetical protein
MKNKLKYLIISPILIIIVWFWAYYMFAIKTIEDNVNEPIKVSDYNSKNSFSYEELKNLKWPITLQYNLKNDSEYISNVMKIDEYVIDFDGDWKIDETYKVDEGKDIFFKYKNSWKYNPKWTYRWTDKITGTSKDVEIRFPELSIN